MQPKNEIPVYLFCGFLESGKTKYIQSILEDPRFNKGDGILLLLCEEGDDGIRTYRTELVRDAVTLRETEHFLDRVFGGSVSLMLSAMTNGKRLTGEEIDALYEVLRQAEEAEKEGS